MKKAYNHCVDCGATVKNAGARCMPCYSKYRQTVGQRPAAQQARRGLVALLIAFVSLLTSAATGASVSLAWNRNAEPEVAGYKLYYGRASRSYANIVSVGNTNFVTVTNLAPAATYYFAVVAVTTNGLESDFSAEVSSTMPVTPPVNFRVITNSLQGATSPDGPWRDVATFTVEVPTNSETAFYRGRLEIR